MDNTIRVRIVAADTDSLRIAPVDDIQHCKRCAEGNGCGSRPWFRGFFRQRDIVLPNNGDWRAGEDAELVLTSAGLNLSAALTYGLPLFALLCALFLARHLPEGGQILAALTALLVAPVPVRPLRRRIVARHLRLQRLADRGVCRYPAQKSAEHPL